MEAEEERLRRNTAEREDAELTNDRRRSTIARNLSTKSIGSVSSASRLVGGLAPPPLPPKRAYTGVPVSKHGQRPTPSVGKKFHVGVVDSQPFGGGGGGGGGGFNELEDFDESGDFEEPDWDELEGPAAAPLDNMGFSGGGGGGGGSGKQRAGSRASTASHIKDARLRAASRAQSVAGDHRPPPPESPPPHHMPRKPSVGDHLPLHPHKKQVMLKRTDSLVEGIDHRSEDLRRHMCACRVLICGIAVALLWCTPLYVAKQLVGGYLHMPSADTGIDRCVDLMSWATETRQDYDRCVDEQDWQCRARWSAALPLAVAGLKRTQDENAAALLGVEAQVEACSLSSARYVYSLATSAFSFFYLLTHSLLPYLYSLSPAPARTDSTRPGRARPTARRARSTTPRCWWRARAPTPARARSSTAPRPSRRGSWW
jgi:hypothetical protein